MTGFSDNGGAVISIPRVQLIFWGSSWTDNPAPTPSAADITGSITELLSSGYMTGLQQYRNIGLGYLLGSVTVSTSSPPNNFADSDVSGLVSSLISGGTIPDLDATNQTLYMVIMPQGVNSASAGIIGEHTYYNDSSNRRVHFGWVTNDGTLSGVTTIFSHELVESCTDPEGTAILGTPGTCSGGGWCEIGDVCQGTDGTVSGVSVQSYWSQKDSQCMVFDFPSASFPVVGTQWTGTVGPSQSQTWFTYNWPAYEHVMWSVLPVTASTSGAQLQWNVAVQRASGAYVTYWITVTNLTSAGVDFQGNYAILGY